MTRAPVQQRPGGDGTSLLARPRHLTRRSLPALLIGLTFGVGVLTPAVSGAAAFLTKAKADKRFLGNTSIATSTAMVAGGSASSLTVSCPAGRQATNGGADSPFFLTSPTGSEGVVVTETRPVVTGGRATGWYVEVFTGSGGPYTVTAYAVCAP